MIDWREMKRCQMSNAWKRRKGVRKIIKKVSQKAFKKCPKKAYKDVPKKDEMVPNAKFLERQTPNPLNLTATGLSALTESLFGVMISYYTTSSNKQFSFM